MRIDSSDYSESRLETFNSHIAPLLYLWNCRRKLFWHIWLLLKSHSGHII